MRLSTASSLGPSPVPGAPSARASAISCRSAHLAEQRRCRADADGAAAEGLERQAEAGEILGRSEQAGGVVGGELDHLRDQEQLGGRACGRVGGFKALVD